MTTSRGGGLDPGCRFRSYLEVPGLGSKFDGPRPAGRTRRSRLGGMWPNIDDLEDLESSVLDDLEAVDDRAPEGTSSLERARRRRAATRVDGLLSGG